MTLPPRHGKSQLISKYTPPWFLSRYPSKNVILASYAAGFAANWGRQARRIIEEYGPEVGVYVDEQSKAADRWDIAGAGGGMITAGVGGPITGKGADLFIVDDPIKNQQEANSLVFRNKVWEWWQSTAYTRLEPGGSVLGVLTRWHEDDWIGRLLKHQDDEGEKWTLINIPAFACADDPLGRAEGECLWPERYPVERLERIRQNIGAYYWSALYQQTPTPVEGGIFNRDRFRYFEKVQKENADFYRLHYHDGYEDVPVDDCLRFATVDLAASLKKTADYTVICTVAVTPKKQLLVLDIDRKRLEGPDQISAMERNYFKFRPAYIGIESVAYQMTAVQHAIRAGLPVREIHADRDKVSRATTLGVRYEQGNVYHLAGSKWILDLEGELLGFPNAEHDDIVDALAYAAVEVMGGQRYLVGVV